MDSIIANTYFSLWNKYRPAILKLMLASADSPQEYKMFSHEFRQLNPKEKGGYAFVLQAFQGKAQNNIKTSGVAKDLLSVLENSNKASELMKSVAYEFKLDKNFIFHVKELPGEEIPEEELTVNGGDG